MLLLLRTNIWTFRPHRFMLRLRLKILQGVHANRSRYPLGVKRLICPRKYSVLQEPHLIPNLNIPDCAVLSVLISSIIIRSKMFFAVSIFFPSLLFKLLTRQCNRTLTDARKTSHRGSRSYNNNIDWRQTNESLWITESQQTDADCRETALVLVLQPFSVNPRHRSGCSLAFHIWIQPAIEMYSPWL